MMTIKKSITVLLLISMIFTLTSCWNYKEVNQLNIVVGAAIDKGESNNYMLTVELIHVKGNADVNVSSEVMSIEGDTLLDAVRRFNSITGKRAYWAHIRVVIVCEDIASEDLSRVLGFFVEDAETRSDVFIVISRECKAKDILNADLFMENVVAETINRSLKNSKVLSEFQQASTFSVSKELKTNKKSVTIPTISLLPMDDKKATFINGTAIFKDNKLTAFIDGSETKTMLFLKNDIESGVIVTKYNDRNITLEILDNTTRIKTRIDNDVMTVNVLVDTQTAINEVERDIDFSDIDIIKDIEKLSEIQLVESMEGVIDKAKHYGTDIFGFTQKLYENHPKKFRQIENLGEVEFRNINVDISVKVRILNSGEVSKL